MGVLDDAIREHLELKRQHGATDEEIAQAEAEALGPARREPALGTPFPGELPTEPAGGDTELLLPEDQPVAPETAEAGAPIAGEAPPPEGSVPASDLPPPPGVYDDVEEIEPTPLGHPDAPTPDPGYGETPPADPDALVPDPDAPHGDDPLAPETRQHGDPATGEDEDFEPDEVPSDEALSSSQEALSADTLVRETRPIRPHDDEDDGPPQPALPPRDPPAAGDREPGETPDFREEEQGEDTLWFEQKPRGDHDFDD